MGTGAQFNNAPPSLPQLCPLVAPRPAPGNPQTLWTAALCAPSVLCVPRNYIPPLPSQWSCLEGKASEAASHRSHACMCQNSGVAKKPGGMHNKMLSRVPSGLGSMQQWLSQAWAKVRDWRAYQALVLLYAAASAIG